MSKASIAYKYALYIDQEYVSFSFSFLLAPQEFVNQMPEIQKSHYS